MRRLVRALAVLLGLLAALLLAFVVANWAPDRSYEELAPRWAPPPSERVDIAGLKVHLRDEGPRDGATPVVLVHGTSASLHTWDAWAAELSKTRRVLRFDLPGFGLTGPAPDGDYRIDAYVRFVTAVLDARGVQSAVLAGNSLGGHVCWATAAAHPERVKGLVLVDSAGYPRAPKSVPLGFRLAQLPGISRLLQVTLPRRVVQQSIENVYGDPSKVTPELVDRYFELTLFAGNRAALPQRLAHAVSADPKAELGKVRAPTLVLWGGKDLLIPPEQADAFVRDIAGAKLVRFEALGHVPQEEDPAQSLAPVLEFLGGL